MSGTTPTLDTLLIGAIPLLTDKELDALYAELSWQRLLPTRAEAHEYVADIHADHSSCYDGTHSCKLELAGEIYEIDGQARGSDLRKLLDEHPDADTEREIVEYRFDPRRVCHPDCPASVLEGLPALVERWTGLTVEMVVYQRPVGWAARITKAPHRGLHCTAQDTRLLDVAHSRVWNHLPHACMAAAFAACVVLGRKG